MDQSRFFNSRRRRKENFRAAIIGGGPTGISTCQNLLRKLQHCNIGKNVSVKLLDRSCRPLFEGPFAPDQPDFLVCNQIATTMGLSPDALDAFWIWLEKKYPLETREFLSHPPRAEFGGFLQESFYQVQDHFSSVGTITTHVRSAVGLNETPDLVNVQFDDNTSENFDAVVLAISTKTTRYPHLTNCPGFFQSGYPVNHLATRIDPRSKVAILGSSLSAIDCANGLHWFGHVGDINLFSRSGLIPAVLSGRIDYKPYYLSPERLREMVNDQKLDLDRVAKAVVKECSMAMPGTDLIKFLRRSKPLKADDFLAQQLHASQCPQAYQSILRYLFNGPCYGELLYRALSLADQKLAKEDSRWKAYRHSMAPPTARLFQSVLARGSEVYAGLERVEPNGSGFVLTHKNCRGKVQKTFANVVVDATGGSCHLEGSNNPLLKSVIDTGLSSAHPAGGLEINFSSLKLTNSRRVYAAGQLLSGAFLYVSGQDATARFTDQIAEGIVDQIVSDDGNRLRFSDRHSPWDNLLNQAQNVG